MTNLLQVQKAFKSFASKVIFSEASFAVNEGEHVGVIGPNGAGKTTLFKILTDQDTFDAGEIVKAKILRLGYLAQHDSWKENETAEDYLAHCLTPLWDLKSLGRQLGLSEAQFQAPITSLSGGYRMRCKLLFLIGQQPNLMLLDEPTNYLDLETTLVLENFLREYRGAFLLISHDREFLRRTTDHVLEVEQGEITKYNGNIDDYFEQKQMLRDQLEARAMSLKEKRDTVLAFVARFGAKASKAKQAQSRLKSLDRMETVETIALPVSAAIRIPEPVSSGKTVATYNGVDLGYGKKNILKNINLTIMKGDHIAALGLNGVGKSTFLKSLSGELKPSFGNIELGYQVNLGFYAQHVAENLNPSSNVIDEMSSKIHAGVTRQDCLNMAGSLLFSGDEIKKKISVLSGGEKSRVALGQILLQRCNFLVLDEPTNHLDFHTVEALTQALSKYSGTLVVVSHDRSFMSRVGKKILEIDNGKVSFYPGTYNEYLWSLQKGILSERSQPEPKPLVKETVKTASTEHKGVFDKDSKKIDKQMAQLEKAMATLQEKMQTLNDLLANSQGIDLSPTIAELAHLASQHTEAESKWYELAGQQQNKSKT